MFLKSIFLKIKRRVRNFFNSRKEADTPAYVASVTDDVSQSELLIVENEIKKSTQVK